MTYRVGGRGQFGGYWHSLPWAGSRGFPSAQDFPPARDYCPSPEKDRAPSSQEYTPLPKTYTDYHLWSCLEIHQSHL